MSSKSFLQVDLKADLLCLTKKDSSLFGSTEIDRSYDSLCVDFDKKTISQWSFYLNFKFLFKKTFLTGIVKVVLSVGFVSFSQNLSSLYSFVSSVNFEKYDSLSSTVFF